MRAFKQGGSVRVTADERDIDAFKGRWPASGLGGLRSVSAIFEHNGDLVDLYTNGRSGAGRFDGGALDALLGNMQEYGNRKLRRPNPCSRANPSEGKYIVVNATRKRVTGSYSTLEEAFEGMNDARDDYHGSSHAFHILGPASNKTVAVIDGEGDVRMNPTPKRASLRTRQGTRVRFVPSPASAAMYGQHPHIGEEGTVRPVAGPRGRPMLSLRGPGGGLLYVDWDHSAFQGVSPLDLVVIR